MKMSFIAPREKHFFSLFTKIWLIFISAIVMLLSLFNMFVVYKISDFKTNAIDFESERKVLEARIDAVDHKIGFILRQKAIAEEIYANNLILKDSMKNLFDLVPDQITLNKVLMEKDSLIIYGVTPTKDTYNFLLAAPLKSIFHTSTIIFYLNDNGWYNFVSTNKIINPDMFEGQ
jgi:hypothetical protein